MYFAVSFPVTSSFSENQLLSYLTILSFLFFAALIKMTWPQKGIHLMAGGNWTVDGTTIPLCHRNPALSLPDSVVEEHSGHPGSREQVATTTWLCIGWEEARAKLWWDLGFPSSTSPRTWSEVAVLVLPSSAWQMHPQPGIAWGMVTLVQPSCPGQNKELFAGSAPKCCLQVLSRLTDQLVDFEENQGKYLKAALRHSRVRCAHGSRLWSTCQYLLAALPQGMEREAEENERPASQG